MSENEKLKSKTAILGFAGLALVALFLFIGHSFINNGVTANIENIEEVAEVVVEDNTSETTEVTAEKVILNDDALEIDVIADPASTNVE
jgi:HAMP domain-containing protein